MDVYVVEWACEDVGLEDNGPAQFEIRAFGKCRDGRSVVVRVAFYPYFFVATPGWTAARQRLFIADMMRQHDAHETHSMPVSRKDAWGYSTEPTAFVQLAFSTLKAQRICRSRVAKSGQSTYEGSVDPVVRLCHVRKIAPTGWIRVDRFTDAKERAFPRADLEICAAFTAVGPSEIASRPPLVLCSWDIEVMSHDGSFPTPDVPENHVIQIASAFQKLGDPEPYRSVVVCLHETAPVESSEIISVATETDVYAEWLRVLEEEKVDIFMGWNTW